MKFKKIELNNFMRYKGKNEIEFSCNSEKNVTVILGDNTVGKTTIAQAFRWGLYGAILVARDKRSEDYILLNNDVFQRLDGNSRASVSVIIVAEDAEKEYTITREVNYTRGTSNIVPKESYKKVALQIADKNDPISIVSVDDNKIDEVINELFPKDLSHYFLFDGERWDDVSYNGVKQNIKDSVHILTGISSYQAALTHLKDMGASSVVKMFKRKISGTGNVYDSLLEDSKRMERNIHNFEDEIATIDINIKHYEKRCAEIEGFLETNKNTEEMQRRLKQTGVVYRSQAERYITNYKVFVNDFSANAYMLFAKPMIDEALKKVKTVAGERRDIPHMHQKSIDYIIKSGTCICGNPIKEGSHELKCLLEQRGYLPPADVGSLLGEFEKQANRWINATKDFLTEIKSEAESVDISLHDYKQTEIELHNIRESIEQNIDFADKRKELKSCKDEINKLCQQKGERLGQIESCKSRLVRIDEEMQRYVAKTAENEKWKKRLDLAEQVYEKMYEEFSVAEKKTFLELNEQVQVNFDRMFNAKDKKISLSPQYEIKMSYKTDAGYREEKNLSEGEKIARNFAFIVTIMDYSRKKKAEKQGGEIEDCDTLPIVLDGPFSKLGDENIQLISGVLPQVSEQVILFMLQKDWRYTGLDDFVGATYHIDKDPDKAYASISRGEES